MKTKILNTIKKYNMISKGDTIAVALSGGADSMALFHFLCSEKDNLGISLIALHVNHGLRPESEEEEQFVKKYCDAMQVKCIISKQYMDTSKKPQGQSTELWARNLRYNFFLQNSKEYNAKIATAHTLSDKTETLLFNITRGSGIKGLVSIPSVRDNIIRPVIDCTRDEIEAYCNNNNVPFVNDETNFQDIYSRNKIRLNVVPQLKQINPSLEKSVANLSEEISEIHTLLTQLSDNLYKKSVGVNGFLVDVILQEDPVIIKYLIRNILEKYNCLNYDNVTAIYNGLNNQPFTRQLTKNIFCQVNNGYLSFYKPTLNIEIKKNSPIKIENFDNNIEFISNIFHFSVINYNDIDVFNKNNKNYLTYMADYDKICSTLILRNRKLGDKIYLPKRKVTKTLKKLFIEDKLSQNIKDNLAVLSTQEDDVVWVENYGINGIYKINKDTKSVLIIQLL